MKNKYFQKGLGFMKESSQKSQEKGAVFVPGKSAQEETMPIEQETASTILHSTIERVYTAEHQMNAIRYASSVVYNSIHTHSHIYPTSSSL